MSFKSEVTKLEQEFHWKFLERLVMAAIDDLTAADGNLVATVAKVIADWAAALSAANSGNNDAAIEKVVADMNTAIANLNAADPANTVTPPADTTTTTDTVSPASPAGS
jgi:hypothetical protein